MVADHGHRASAGRDLGGSRRDACVAPVCDPHIKVVRTLPSQLAALPVLARKFVED